MNDLVSTSSLSLAELFSHPSFLVSQSYFTLYGTYIPPYSTPAFSIPFCPYPSFPCIPVPFSPLWYIYIHVTHPLHPFMSQNLYILELLSPLFPSQILRTNLLLFQTLCPYSVVSHLVWLPSLQPISPPTCLKHSLKLVFWSVSIISVSDENGFSANFGIFLNLTKSFAECLFKWPCHTSL